jgi:hypothetical protein
VRASNMTEPKAIASEFKLLGCVCIFLSPSQIILCKHSLRGVSNCFPRVRGRQWLALWWKSR